MIGIKLLGGLGNQMFQYAFGRAISKKLNSPLILDTAWFYNIPKSDTPRTFDLNSYKIRGSLIRSDQESPFLIHKTGYLQKIISKLSKKNLMNFPQYIVEKKIEFSKISSNLKEKTYFDGYWQSPLYFEEIREILLDEFTPVDIKGSDEELANEIELKNAVSIHIRRGDYVNNEYAKSRHLVCDHGYYERAIKHISNLEKEIKFYFFSDDPEWVKKEFSNLNMEVIEGNHDRPWMDIYLMTKCKHHIIANSSFSWWGAWLSQRDGITIAPKSWFTDGNTMDDLIPDSWVRL